MKRLVRTAAVLALVAPWAARAYELRWGVLAGYNSDVLKNGLGVRAEVVAPIPRKPFAFSFGVGYTFIDPGDAYAARRIFINDNVDGRPKKTGYFLDLKLDVIAYLATKRFENVGLFVGARHDVFRGRFRYEGGNEDFTVSADDWGLGLGGRGEVKLSGKVNVLGSLGLDVYPWGTLYGHDTTYRSNGNNDNAKHDYTWKDADKAINQPRYLLSAMVGLAW